MNKIIITGGAGFIGTNLSLSALAKGYQVIIFDNLSRPGVANNLKVSKQNPALTFIEGDIKNSDQVENLIRKHRDASAIFHLAGQVAVTLSIENPREDFESNALGTFNLLEAARINNIKCPILYASTNKVYGDLKDSNIVEKNTRYQLKDYPNGISENQSLDLHSPYGCSKGIGDQYMLDYHRIYGLNTIVFRQSCIYGTYQLGIEDQGWLAWFTIATLNNLPITLFGTGKQVRDVLFIDDLLDAYWKAIENIETTSGQAYNIGGGKHQLSLLELLGLLEKISSKKIPVSKKQTRAGDQKVYISDTSKALRDFSWQPTTSPESGLNQLITWIKNNQEIFIKAKIINENIRHS